VFNLLKGINMLRRKAQLYCFLRSITKRLEKHIVAELRAKGFHFSDEKASDVIWSITIGDVTE
jgi:hypothetical protein